MRIQETLLTKIINHLGLYKLQTYYCGTHNTREAGTYQYNKYRTHKQRNKICTIKKTI